LYSLHRVNNRYLYLCIRMMGIYRNKILKCTFCLVLLGIFLVKFCVFSISAFSSSAETYAIEKSTEENKDKEEESSDKSKKQALHHESLGIAYEHPAGTTHLPILTPLYQLSISTFPPRNVPTPPPDLFS